MQIPRYFSATSNLRFPFEICFLKLLNYHAALPATICSNMQCQFYRQTFHEVTWAVLQLRGTWAGNRNCTFIAIKKTQMIKEIEEKYWLDGRDSEYMKLNIFSKRVMTTLKEEIYWDETRWVCVHLCQYLKYGIIFVVKYTFYVLLGSHSLPKVRELQSNWAHENDQWIVQAHLNIPQSTSSWDFSRKCSTYSPCCLSLPQHTIGLTHSV